MTIEQQIANALNGAASSADKLAQLISETEAAMAAAELAAAAARIKALDLTADPEQVLAVQRKAELTRDRLQAALPRLQARQQQVADAEEYGKWSRQFDALKPKHAAAAEKLRAIYTQFQDQLVEALVEAKQVDQEIRRIANLKPHHLPQANGDHRALPTVEAAARGLPSVPADFSLMQLKLPVFDAPNQLAWPPYEIPLAVQVARSMVPVSGDPRQFTDRWHEVAAEKAQAARQQRLREQQEEQARIDADPRADQWWKVQSA